MVVQPVGELAEDPECVRDEVAVAGFDVGGAAMRPQRGRCPGIEVPHQHVTLHRNVRVTALDALGHASVVP